MPVYCCVDFGLADDVVDAMAVLVNLVVVVVVMVLVVDDDRAGCFDRANVDDDFG